jgi:RNA polymerase sigma-70 factor, ECF subfamily
MNEDKALVAAIQRGDREAFRRLYDRHVHGLLSLARNLLADAALAEDAVQDVFTAFVRTSRDFRLNGSVRSYLAPAPPTGPGT